MNIELGIIPSKVEKYKAVLESTKRYREEWNTGLREMIKETLTHINESTDLKGEVVVKDNIQNLESVVLDLGRSSSGLIENIENSTVTRTMVKSNGALVYQQLFNGKVMVMAMNPSIEGYGEPKPPKMVEIVRPEELKPAFILRHFESFLNGIIEWEDYDDDAPKEKKIGFNPIGFGNNGHQEQ